MEVLDLVKIAIDMTQTRSCYVEEMIKLKTNLEVFQYTLKKIDEANVPPQYLNDAKEEMKNTNEWLRTLPDQPTLLDTVKFQLPCNNLVEKIKEKCVAIQHMLTMATALVVTTTIKPIQHSLAVPQPVQMTITQQDDNYLESQEQKQFIQLNVSTDEKTKALFRKHGVNLNNRFPIKFNCNEEETLVHHIKRENFILLNGEIQQVNTISADHAQIICKRKKEVSIEKSQKTQESNTDQEVFYSINDEILNQCQQESKYQYEFSLKITGRLGVFLYRKNEYIIQPSKVIPDSWENRFINTTIQLKEFDKIAILMRKPDYRIPIFSFEFNYQL